MKVKVKKIAEDRAGGCVLGEAARIRKSKAAPSTDHANEIRPVAAMSKPLFSLSFLTPVSQSISNHVETAH
jgi:hypothetical protein